MKSLVLFCLFVGIFGEPPRFRTIKYLEPPRYKQTRFRFERFEIVPTTESSAEPSTESIGGPYPASGWKPAGEPFALPDKKTPVETYGAPYPPSGWNPAGEPFRSPQEQLPPAASYGSPGNVNVIPTTDAPVPETIEERQVEKLEGPVELLKSIGTYFLLLPNGELQEVQLLTENDIQQMEPAANSRTNNISTLVVLAR